MSHRRPGSPGALVAEIRRVVVAHERAIEEVFERYELDPEQRGVVLRDLMLLLTLRWEEIPERDREARLLRELERLAQRVMAEDEEQDDQETAEEGGQAGQDESGD